MTEVDPQDVYERPYKLADYCRRCGKVDTLSKHFRAYCPRCHEVHCGMQRQGEWIVTPHYSQDPNRRHGRNPCLGGPIDPTEDRAP